MGNFVAGILIVGIVIAVLLLWPLAIFWAVGALTGFDIAYTWQTWLATWILMLAFNGGSAK